VLGIPWLRRHRQVVPPHVERGYRGLENLQLNSKARSYVS
jgi:N-acetylglucosaminyl-diphospho-decaprenol L-rhamnosyltransferase